MQNYRNNDLYKNNTSTALLQERTTLRHYDTAGLETQEAIAIEKRVEIEDVQAGVNEIAECQKTLAELVDKQGDNITAAHDNVKDAGDKTAEGVSQLQRANKHAKSSRKYMCCALVLLLLIIGVVVIVMVAKK